MSSLLISVPSAAKKLGIPKKAVLSLIDTGVLVGIAAAGDTYITAQSIESLTGQKSTVDSGQCTSPNRVVSLFMYRFSPVNPEMIWFSPRKLLQSGLYGC